jgi:hypothetical protein
MFVAAKDCKITATALLFHFRRKAGPGFKGRI